MVNKKRKFCLPFNLILLFFIITTCALPTMTGFEVEKTGVEEFFSSSPDITIAWSDDNPSNVQYYNIYYRAHGDSTWIFLNTAPPNAFPSFTVEYSDLSDGLWDFGVSSVDNDNIESEIHSSLDIEADPTTGWYLLWVE